MNVTAARIGLRDLVFEETFGIFRVITAAARALFNFRHAVAQQLAHLERDRSRELVLVALEQRCDFDHQLRAPGERLSSIFFKRRRRGC